ncbi:MAG: RadC family protein [Bacillota bacterium]
MKQKPEPIMVRDIPMEERPRERLMEVGERQLSNEELVALILRTGSAHGSVLDLARRLLKEFDGFHGLADATFGELRDVPGMGSAKICELKAAVEIGRRMSMSPRQRVVIRTPRDVEALVGNELRQLTQEHFVVLSLDSKNQLVGKDDTFTGTLNSSLVHPREVFNRAVRRSAASVVVVHNHPSGDPQPSREDNEVTRRLSEAGKLLGIELLDHIIIGDGRYVSLRERGVLS